MRMNRPMSVDCPDCEGRGGRYVPEHDMPRTTAEAMKRVRAGNVPMTEKCTKTWKHCKRCEGQGFLISRTGF